MKQAIAITIGLLIIAALSGCESSEPSEDDIWNHSLWMDMCMVDAPYCECGWAAMTEAGLRWVNWVENEEAVGAEFERVIAEACDPAPRAEEE